MGKVSIDQASMESGYPVDFLEAAAQFQSEYTATKASNPEEAAMAFRVSPHQLPNSYTQDFYKGLGEYEKSIRTGVEAGGLRLHRDEGTSSEEIVDYESDGGQLVRSMRELIYYMNQGELTIYSMKKMPLQENNSPENAETQGIEIILQDKSGKKSVLYYDPADSKQKLTATQLDHLEKNYPRYQANNLQKPNNWDDAILKYDDALKLLFPVFELKTDASIEPIFMKSLKSGFARETPDCDALFIGIPVSIMQDFDVTYESGLGHATFNPKVLADQQKLYQEQLRLQEKIITDAWQNFLFPDQVTHQGVIHPFELLMIHNINFLWKAKYAESFGLTQQFKDLADLIAFLRKPENDRTENENNFAEFLKSRVFNMLQHGVEARNPKLPESLAAPILHIWKGEYQVTHTEEEHAEFVMQKGYLENNFIPLHPEWNMEIWGKVVEKQLALKHPVDKKVVDAYTQFCSQKHEGLFSPRTFLNMFNYKEPTKKPAKTPALSSITTPKKKS